MATHIYQLAILTSPPQRSINQSDGRKKKNPNYFRDAIPERNLLSFSPRSLCLRYVPLHINHYSTSHLGEPVLAFALLSLTFLSPPGTMLTLRVILCDGYQLAGREAMLLSITIRPRTPVVCRLCLWNITLISVYFYSNEAAVTISSLSSNAVHIRANRWTACCPVVVCCVCCVRCKDSVEMFLDYSLECYPVIRNFNIGS